MILTYAAQETGLSDTIDSLGRSQCPGYLGRKPFPRQQIVYSLVLNWFG